MITFTVLLSFKLVSFPVGERDILDVISADPGDLIMSSFYCGVEYYYLLSDVFNLFSFSDVILSNSYLNLFYVNFLHLCSVGDCDINIIYIQCLIR